MKKLLYYLPAILLLIAIGETQAQSNQSLTFAEKTVDFGNVREETGSVTHTFEFTNNSNQPVKILSVKASCGCTTPDWTKVAVTPGKKGYVVVKYDPTGRLGFFNKSLTVTFDAVGEPIVLTIKGTVVLPGDFTAYRESKGNWRMPSSILNMGKVWLNDEFVWKEFDILNGGEAAITANIATEAPKHIKVILIPAILKPGDKGVIRLGYNGKLKNEYGFQSDNIEIITDDSNNPRKSFSVYATLEEFFPELSVEEKYKTPRLLIHQPVLDMGRVSPSSPAEKFVALMNNGKKELTIRSIQPNCQCIKTALKEYKIGAGKSQVLTVRLDGAQRKGTQQKFITIYSNDPVNPVQRISVGGYVED
jgi:hypothetical protein